ncbi:acyltransferase family protein [Humidisolicoccus flavus]|uniref:acyltransferase family protein n=1 Tax=Humidisolicoccus flavus TaxID=3111414 RepID=UPI003254FFF9
MANSVPDAARTALQHRDLSLDLVRVLCVLLVVVVHTLLVGVRQVEGGIEVEKTVELQSWFTPATWVLQIMPIFFVIGGFASSVGFASLQRRGGDAADFAKSRLLRLARPALPVFAFFAIALAVAGMLDLAPELVATVASGVGSPLWFLAAFVLVQALAPFMLQLHRRAPWLVLAVLFGAGLIVDSVRYFGGEPLFGLPNFAFVWLFAQQLGFWMHDGWFKARRPVSLIGMIALGYLLVWGLTAVIPYSLNMLASQFPPVVPLMCFALTHTCMLTLLSKPLNALMQFKAMQAFVWLFGSRLMTVYLWHLPVILLLVGIQLLLPFALSEPGSAIWWMERPVMVVTALAVVCALSVVLVRFERPWRHDKRPRPAAWRIWVAVVCFFVPSLLIAIQGLSLVLALVGLLGTLVSLILVRSNAQKPAPARQRENAA